jgi:hypothetical protein
MDDRRSGVQWASEGVPPMTLRASAGGHLAHVVEPAGAAMRHDDDRWTNDGGSVGSKVAAGPLRAVTAGR